LNGGLTRRIQPTRKKRQRLNRKLDADMNQATEHWGTFAGEFYRDGSLRDIYVFNTRLRDWANAAAFIVDQKYKVEFSGAWAQPRFPSDIAKLFPKGPESELTVLAIELSGVEVNCHFFSPNEIEFDLDPAEVSDPSKLDGVFNFMKGLANAVGKDVVLTPENMPQIEIFRCRHHGDLVEHTPFGGFS
jgi:hypothetical protein